MASISSLPKAEAPRLPCPAHAAGYGEDHRTMAPGEFGAGQEPDTKPQQPEPYPADRAFHAMLASLTGGVSPVALVACLY